MKKKKKLEKTLVYLRMLEEHRKKYGVAWPQGYTRKYVKN